MKHKMRILFWGSDAVVSVPPLRTLAAWPEVEVCGVITQPDRPVGRSKQALAPVIKTVAEELVLPVFQPETLKGDFSQTISALSADVGVVVGYGRIIPEALLAIPKHGTLNVHPSLLPEYRGPTPVQAAILDGAVETGVSIIVLDALMDHGPIVAQESMPLTGNETTPELEARLAERGGLLLQSILPAYMDGSRIPKTQAHDQATLCHLITRDNGRVNWPADTAVKIERTSRAYQPWPGIWSMWSHGSDQLRVKFFDVKIESGSQPPGTLTIRNDRLFVGTATTPVSFGEVQCEGKKRMPIPELLRGMPAFANGHFQ